MVRPTETVRLAVGVWFLLTATVSMASARPPNIVVILADDLGWADVGWNNPGVHTPTLDAMAREGVLLKQMYVQPTCSPSRAAFMSGRYPYHLGLQHRVIMSGWKQFLPDDQPILPEELLRLGYRTHMVGKWHLGFCAWRYTPTYRGFQSFYGFYNALEDYYNHTGHQGAYDFRDDDQVDRGAVGTYSTHLFAQRAIRVIEQHDVTKPLFLYLSFQAVHGPLQVPQRYMDSHCGHVPPSDEKRRLKCGMVAAMDEAVANVTGALRRRGLLPPGGDATGSLRRRDREVLPQEGNFTGAPNDAGVLPSRVITTGAPMDKRATVFPPGGDVAGALRGDRGVSTPSAGDTFLLFFSDNGGPVHMGGSNWPLRGSKTTLWEGGTRAPAFIYAPALLNKTGYTYDQLIHVSDWFPTFVEAAGDSSPIRHIDGVSQWRNLLSGASPGPRHEFVYNFDDLFNQSAIRQGRYKLVHGHPGNPDGWFAPSEMTTASSRNVSTDPDPDPTQGQGQGQGQPEYQLFDLQDDPLEETDVLVEHPEVFRRMQARMEEYRKSAVPANFPGYTEESTPGKYFNNVWSPGWC